MIRVAVSGAAGRMGQTVCAAVEGADGMELRGRADPALGTALGDVLGDADVVVEFSTPETVLANAEACLDAGVHVVVGATGFELDATALRRRGERGQLLRRAQLRDRRRAVDGGRAEDRPCTCPSAS